MLKSAIAFAFFISAALASPVQRAPLCSPNFQGVAMSVVNPANGREWRIDEPATAYWSVWSRPADRYVADFRIEQTGHGSPAEYIFKTVHDPSNSLVVDVRPRSSHLYLAPFNSSLRKQNWVIRCQKCGTDPWNVKGLYASGCTITSAETNQCVEDTGNDYDSENLTFCDGGATQEWEFWTAYKS